MIEYSLGTSGQTLCISDAVVQHFRRNQQLRCYQREAGGQLFATISVSQIVIVEATGPRPTDRRTRRSYEPDHAAEAVEIVSYHQRNLHFVGDWHTHPEPAPHPSSLDEKSIRECFTQSVHRLHAFVLIIVGTSEIPTGLHVSVNDSTMSRTLQYRREHQTAFVRRT